MQIDLFIFQKSPKTLKKNIIMIIMKFLVSSLNLNLPNPDEELSSSSGDSKYYGILALFSKQFSIYHICGANIFIFQKSTKNQKTIIMIIMKFLNSFLNLNLPNHLKSCLPHLGIQSMIN